MNTTTPWSDTPPSEPGDYHLLARNHSGEIVATYNPVFARPWASGKWTFSASNQWVAAAYQFGPAVLSAEDTVKLTAEVERLRAENAALREKLTVDDLDELERYRSPLGAEPQWSASPGVSVGLAGAMIGFDVAPADGSPSRHALIRESELDQLRAAAAELAEIHRAWGMAAKDL